MMVVGGSMMMGGAFMLVGGGFMMVGGVISACQSIQVSISTCKSL